MVVQTNMVDRIENVDQPPHITVAVCIRLCVLSLGTRTDPARGPVVLRLNRLPSFMCLRYALSRRHRLFTLHKKSVFLMFILMTSDFCILPLQNLDFKAERL